MLGLVSLDLHGNYERESAQVVKHIVKELAVAVNEDVPFLIYAVSPKGAVWVEHAGKH